MIISGICRCLVRFERDCTLCEGAHSHRTLLPPVVLYRHHSIPASPPRQLTKTSKKILSSLSLSLFCRNKEHQQTAWHPQLRSLEGWPCTCTQTVLLPSPNVFLRNFGLLVFFLATGESLQKAFITVSGEKDTKTKGKQSTSFPKPSGLTKQKQGIPRMPTCGLRRCVRIKHIRPSKNKERKKKVPKVVMIRTMRDERRTINNETILSSRQPRNMVAISQHAS